MAIGNTASTKGRIHELQQASEPSKCRMESEFRQLSAQRCCAEAKMRAEMPLTGELAKGLDLAAVADGHGRTVYVEVLVRVVLLEP